MGAHLALHVDGRGVVWHDAGGVVCPSVPSESFLTEKCLAGVTLVTLYGSRSNANLISRLSRWSRDGGGVVLLAQPDKRLELSSDVEIVRSLSLRRRANCGAVYTAGPVDYCTYAIVDAVASSACDAAARAAAAGLVRRHPIWPAISFFDRGGNQIGADLVYAIVDPRWFRDFQHTDRLGRLYAYLGLTDVNARAYAEHGRLAGRHYERAEAALELVDAHRGVCGDNWLALLRAARRAVRLLVLLWLLAVAGHPEAYFDSRLFFGASPEAARFEAHLAAIQAVAPGGAGQ